MKILDSTIIIAILGDIKCPKLIDDILKLNHDLIMSNSVHCEILKGSSADSCSKIINANKIQIKKINKQSELIDLQKTYPYLGLGELDTILTYEKLVDSSKVYCILDDKQARKVAERRKISFTGTLGTLCLMRDRNILSQDEFQNIVNMLKKSKFRLPKETC